MNKDKGFFEAGDELPKAAGADVDGWLNLDDPADADALIPYISREGLQGRTTKEMIDAMGAEEVKSIKAVARILNDILPGIPEHLRPYLSTIDVANLAVYLASGCFDPIVTQYREIFVMALIDWFNSKLRANIAKPLAAALEQIAALFSDSEITALWQLADARSKQNPQFDLSFFSSNS